MNSWTHSSSWRLWFTCKTAATAWAPSSEIWLDPRLQNVRKWQIRSQNYSNVKSKSNEPIHMCCNLPPIKPTFEKFTHIVPTVCFWCNPQAFHTISAHTWEQHYSVQFLGSIRTWSIYWTHSSSWRVWFTCNTPANSWAPSSEIWFLLRLQNVREQEMRGGLTNLFTFCKVYFGLSTPLVRQTACQGLHITMTTCK